MRNPPRYGGKLYPELADDAWRAVEIDAQGWRLVDEPPVRFRRAAGMQPQPISGGSVEALRQILNVGSDDVLVLAWALAVLSDRGPYPVKGLKPSTLYVKIARGEFLPAIKLGPSASTAKWLTWISGPFARNGHGRNHRITVPRFCRRCGWDGDDRPARAIESWFPSSPCYCVIWPACPRCSARIERR